MSFSKVMSENYRLKIKNFCNKINTIMAELYYKEDEYELSYIDNVETLTDAAIVLRCLSLDGIERVRTDFRELFDICDGLSAELDEKYGVKCTFYLKNAYTITNSKEG
jgi:hypothetical protein